jgi:hypothetical protein
MHCSLLKFTLVLCPAVLLWKLLVFEFLLQMTDDSMFHVSFSSKNGPSARRPSATNVLCSDVDFCL